MEHLSELDAGSIPGALEALLLVSSDPVRASQLAGILGSTPGEIASRLADLQVEYEEAKRGLQLREVAGGWRLFTHPAFHDQVESFVLSWDTQRLSQAALETLAVIAYQGGQSRFSAARGRRGLAPFHPSRVPRPGRVLCPVMGYSAPFAGRPRDDRGHRLSSAGHARNGQGHPRRKLRWRQWSRASAA